MTVTTQPTIGTHASDGFCQGPQFDANYGKIWPYSSNAPVGRGSFNSPLRVYDIKPQPASFTNIAAAQTIGAANYMQLATVSGNGVTVTTYAGQAAVATDVPRAVQILGYTGTASMNFTIYGVDQYGFSVTEQITGPTGATIATGKKCFAYIYRIYVSGNTNANVSVGCADIFELPYVAVDRNYITPYWGGYLDNTLPLTTYATSAAFTAGVGTINNQNINAVSLGFASYNTPGTACGRLAVKSGDIIGSNLFKITSTQAGGTTLATDVSTANWRFLKPGPHCGTATLSGNPGAVTITNSLVTANSLIFITINTPGTGTQGVLEITAQTAGSFTVTSTGGTNDNSTFNYLITNPSRFAGTSTLVAGTITINATTNPGTPPYIVNSSNADSIILVTRKSINGSSATGFLGAPNGSISNGQSFVINSNAADTTLQTNDVSVVNWMILNPVGEGIFTLPDSTSPATISSGDVYGTYAPSTPSDGIKRLTVSMYVRATDPVANFIGNANDDTALQSTETNLYGVAQYSDTNH